MLTIDFVMVDKARQHSALMSIFRSTPQPYTTQIQVLVKDGKPDKACLPSFISGWVA